MLKKYIKPKSLTWIVGVALVTYGCVIKDYNIIGTGLGFIGIRGAIKD